MSQKHVQLHQSVIRQTPRDLIWTSIRKYKFETFTVTAIRKDTRLTHDTVRRYLQGLTNAGYVEIAFVQPGIGAQVIHHYRLINDVGIDAPSVQHNGAPMVIGQGREALWRTMKIIHNFTARELALAASTEEYSVAVSDAAYYLRYLQRAGYLAIVEHGKPGIPIRYRFQPSHNTGPRPPIIRKIRQVFDQNINQAVWSIQEAINVSD